jgi:hypothetical protein
MREVEAAWKRAQVLSKTRLRLDFAVDTVANRVWVDLAMPDGTPIGRLNSRAVLALACGEPVDDRLDP